MKKKTNDLMAKLIPVMIFLLAALPGKAQICPGHTIFNNTNCSVTINYKVFDGLSPTCATLCSGTGIVIIAGGNFSLPAACFSSTNADIELTVEYPPAGTGVFTTGVNFGSGGGGGPWACYNGGAPAISTYTGTGPAFCTPPFVYMVNIPNCLTSDIF